MPENITTPEVIRKPNPLEAAKKVVDMARSTITDKKKLGLITAGLGLIFLSACGTYTEATTDSRQATVMEIQPIDISGLQSEHLDFIQIEKNKIVDVLREVVSDDILNHYNDINLETNPSSIKQQKMYFDKYGTSDWEGILYPKGKENTLLGLGGNKKNSFGSGENIPFAISIDMQGNISIKLKPYAYPRSTHADKQGKLVAAGDPNTVFVREFIPELVQLRDDEVIDNLKGRIPLSNRKVAAKRMLNIPENATFEPDHKDDPYSVLSWRYDLPNRKHISGFMMADGTISVTVSPPRKNP